MSSSSKKSCNKRLSTYRPVQCTTPSFVKSSQYLDEHFSTASSPSAVCCLQCSAAAVSSCTLAQQQLRFLSTFAHAQSVVDIDSAERRQQRHATGLRRRLACLLRHRRRRCNRGNQTGLVKTFVKSTLTVFW